MGPDNLPSDQQGAQASGQGFQGKTIERRLTTLACGGIHPDRVTAVPEERAIITPAQGEIEIATAAIKLQFKILFKQPFTLRAANFKPQHTIQFLASVVGGDSLL